MAANVERLNVRAHQDAIVTDTLSSIISRVNETVSLAKIEAKNSGMATTKEGTFALTYILASRDLLRPALTDISQVSEDLLREIGGQGYNPERSIDLVGSRIATELAQQTNGIHNFWMRTEESTDWEHLSHEDAPVTQGERFAIVDPLDMTSSIPRRDRVQTSGIAIYDRQGELKSLGIISLVDDDFIFIENKNGELTICSSDARHAGTDRDAGSQLLVAAKTRRLHMLRNTQLLTTAGRWALDCDSGYAVLSLHRGDIDTIVDHIRGNPWHEVTIWARAAQALGYPVSDKDGNEIDISAIMRRVIEKHENDTYRIPFIISRTPEIHKKVLQLV